MVIKPASNELDLELFAEFSGSREPSEKRIRDLVIRGANINGVFYSEMEDGYSVLDKAILYSENDETKWIKLTLELGADPNFINKTGYNCLYYAEGYIKQTRTLLEAGADPNCVGLHECYETIPYEREGYYYSDWGNGIYGTPLGFTLDLRPGEDNGTFVNNLYKTKRLCLEYNDMPRKVNDYIVISPADGDHSSGIRFPSKKFLAEWTGYHFIISDLERIAWVPGLNIEVYKKWLHEYPYSECARDSRAVIKWKRRLKSDADLMRQYTDRGLEFAKLIKKAAGPDVTVYYFYQKIIPASGKTKFIHNIVGMDP